MKKTKIALIFLSGLFSGGIAGYILALKKPFHENLFGSPTNEIFKNFKENFDKGYKQGVEESDTCGLNEAHDILVEQSKNRKYITIDKHDGNDKDATKTETDDREDSDNDRTKFDREYLSDIVQTKTFDSSSDASEDVEGTLHLVKENDISEEVTKPSVKTVSSIEFVKSVASGSEFRSLIFNTMDKEIYWNFTNQKVDKSDCAAMIGEDLMKTLLDESNYNANGWVSTRYLYNETYEFYVKIESQLLLSIDNN